MSTSDGNYNWSTLIYLLIMAIFHCYVRFSSGYDFLRIVSGDIWALQQGPQWCQDTCYCQRFGNGELPHFSRVVNYEIILPDWLVIYREQHIENRNPWWIKVSFPWTVIAMISIFIHSILVVNLPSLSIGYLYLMIWVMTVRKLYLIIRS